MEDCSKCKQTTQNCECHIPDEQKHKGFLKLIKDIKTQEIVKEYYFEKEIERDPFNNPYTARQVYLRFALLIGILTAMTIIIIVLSNM